jgi:hypothetical protein
MTAPTNPSVSANQVIAADWNRITNDFKDQKCTDLGKDFSKLMKDTANHNATSKNDTNAAEKKLEQAKQDLKAAIKADHNATSRNDMKAAEKKLEQAKQDLRAAIKADHNGTSNNDANAAEMQRTLDDRQAAEQQFNAINGGISQDPEAHQRDDRTQEQNHYSSSLLR